MVDPVPLPKVGFRAGPFDPIQPRDTNRMEGRRTEGQKFGTPYWVAKYQTTSLTDAEFGLVEAFMMSAGDNGETFLGYDVTRPRPILHDDAAHNPLSGVKAGGGAFNGDASLLSILNPLLIQVGGLPIGFRLSPGDYVEVRRSPLVRSLHRVSAATMSDGAGTCIIPIKFALDVQTFTLPCTVHFEKPSCVMQIDPGSYSAPKELITREASWSATEMFFS